MTSCDLLYLCHHVKYSSNDSQLSQPPANYVNKLHRTLESIRHFPFEHLEDYRIISLQDEEKAKSTISTNTPNSFKLLLVYNFLFSYIDLINDKSYR